MSNTSIKARYLLIDQRRVSAQAKEILQELKTSTNFFKDVAPELREEFNNFYSKIKSQKPEAIRGTNEYDEYGKPGFKEGKMPDVPKSLIKLIRKERKIRKSQGLRTDTDSIMRDAARPALPPGKRKSADGNIYYEYRANRSDRRRKKYPLLKDGGKINGYDGETAEEIWAGWNQSQRIHFISDHTKKQYTPVTQEGLAKKTFKFLPTKIKEELKKHISEGQYASGGSTDGVVQHEPHRSEMPEFADGGVIANKILYNNDGFTITEIKNYLDEQFPDSFGFSLHHMKEGSRQAQLLPEMKTLRGLTDKEIKEKIYFPPYKNRGIAVHLYQGGENTYFDFAIEGFDTSTEYIGSFGFKDQGDVDKSYITKFLTLLMDCYQCAF